MKQFFLYFFVFVLSYSPFAFCLDNSDASEGVKEGENLQEPVIQHSEMVKEFILQDCTEHLSHISPLIYEKAVKDCLSKNVDDGLYPICSQEQALRRELVVSVHQKRYDEAHTISEELSVIEDDKYAVANTIYELATVFDEITNVINDRVEGMAAENDNNTFKIFALAPITVVIPERDAFTRFVDNRILKLCEGFDLSRIEVIKPHEDFEKYRFPEDKPRVLTVTDSS